MTTADGAIRWSAALLRDTGQKEILDAVGAFYQANGYNSYNPFPGGTGTPSGTTSLVRLFISQRDEGWTKIIGVASIELLTGLRESLGASGCYAWITDSSSGVEPVGVTDLASFLRDGKTSEYLTGLLQALKAPLSSAQPVSDTPLKGEIAAFAGQYGVDEGQASKLIEKTTGRILKKLGGEGTEAKALAAQQAQSPLESEAGQRLKTVMDSLILPENWYEPGFRELSAAYQIACMLDQDEDAPLLPGDEEILDRVEYPLDYEPAYYAR